MPHPVSYLRQKNGFAKAAAEPPLANLAASVLISPGRNNRPALRRNGRFSGSSGGKRRPEPHGHKSFRPSFSTSSVSTPTIRLPRLTRDSLEGTPGGACQTAQKDVSVSWSRYMIVHLVIQSRRIVACEAQVPRAVSTGADTRSRSRSQRQIRAFWCPVGMHNHASGRAIGAGTVLLIVSPELCSRKRWNVVNKPLARSVGASGYAPLVSRAYLRTRRE